MDLSSRRALTGYLVLFATLYAGFGVQSPYLPALLKEHGLSSEAIGTVLATGAIIRLATGPAAGRLADRLDAARLVFAGCAAVAAIAGISYLAAYGFWPLLAVVLLQAAVLAPLAPSVTRSCSSPLVRCGPGSNTVGCVVSGQQLLLSAQWCRVRSPNSTALAL
jgi:MFS family permease